MELSFTYFDAVIPVKPFSRNSEFKLHQAAAYGDSWNLNGLLSDGWDMNSRDSNGKTPLHRAAENGQVKVVALLLERGADYWLKDNNGQTAQELAYGKVETQWNRIFNSSSDKQVCN